MRFVSYLRIDSDFPKKSELDKKIVIDEIPKVGYRRNLVLIFEYNDFWMHFEIQNLITNKCVHSKSHKLNSCILFHREKCENVALTIIFFVLILVFIVFNEILNRHNVRQISVLHRHFHHHQFYPRRPFQSGGKQGSLQLYWYDLKWNHPIQEFLFICNKYRSQSAGKFFSFRISAQNTST
jgi:hypothetical protein